MFYAIVRTEAALLEWLLTKILNLSAAVYVGGVGKFWSLKFLFLSLPSISLVLQGTRG